VQHKYQNIQHYNSFENLAIPTEFLSLVPLIVDKDG